MIAAPYDLIAAEYYAPAHQTSRNFDAATAHALSPVRGRLSSKGLVLDVGAGKGRAGEYLGISAKRLIQMDSSRLMLLAEPREDCLLRLVHPAEQLPFLDSQFACVTAFLCDAFLGLSFLSEAHRVLTSGGLFVATTPSHEWGTTLRRELGIDPSLTRFQTKTSVVHVPSVLVPRDRLRAMLVRAGFAASNVEVKGVRLPADVSPVSPDITRPAVTLGKQVHELEILDVVVASK